MASRSEPDRRQGKAHALNADSRGPFLSSFALAGSQRAFSSVDGIVLRRINRTGLPDLRAQAIAQSCWPYSRSALVDGVAAVLGMSTMHNLGVRTPSLESPADDVIPRRWAVLGSAPESVRSLRGIGGCDAKGKWTG